MSPRSAAGGRGPAAAALLIAAVSVALLAALAWGVFVDTAVAQWDRAALAWIRNHAPPASVRLLGVVSDLHRPVPILAATAVALALLLWRRERAAALLLAAVVVGGAMLNHALKHGLQRPRPGDEGVWAAGTDFAFPSGHVANATLLYATLALLIASRARSRALRVAAPAGAASLVALVAASRLVLGAHYPSDVLAGAALGVGWLALCVVALRPPRS